MRLALSFGFISLCFCGLAIAQPARPPQLDAIPDVSIVTENAKQHELKPLIYDQMAVKNSPPDFDKMTSWFKRAQQNAKFVTISERKVIERQRRLQLAKDMFPKVQQEYQMKQKATYTNARLAAQAKALSSLRLVRVLIQIEMSKLKLWHQTELTRILTGPTVVVSDSRLISFANALLTKRRETKIKLDEMFSQYGTQISDAAIRPQFSMLVQATNAEFSNARH